MRNNERHPKAIKQATLYGLVGVGSVYGGLIDLAHRANIVTTETFPRNTTVYQGIRDRVGHYGEEKAAVLDVLVMLGGFAAIARSAILSETPQPLPKRSPLAGKEFPYDTYDVEKS